MDIPRENALAFWPRSVKAGNLTLGPLTLTHVVRLAELGLDFGRRIPMEKLFQAAYVLGGTRSAYGCVGLAPSARVADGTDGTEAVPPVASVATRTGRSPSLPEFCKRARVGLKELSNAVETVINDAYETYLKPAKEKGGVISLSPHGLGWPLEYAEFLCGEYGWSWETAINFPVVTTFALVAAYRQRNGGKHGGFDYLEKEYAKSLK